MTRLVIAAAAVLAAALLAAAPSPAHTPTEVTILAPDGTQLAATLLLPGGSPPPGGWPAVVYLHGLAGNRASMIEVARSMGVLDDDYAVLAYDARGHGQSGGLIGIDGPREIADARAVFEWLRDRPEVADDRIGAWGISYGGGAAWNSLAAGVPWAALEVVETWTDLYSALMPTAWPSRASWEASSSRYQLQSSTRPCSLCATPRFAGAPRRWLGFAAQRSSLSRLRGVRTPVFMMQGRRDFAFGIDQATRAFALLAGPKRLWIGNHGHAPSSFPAADTPAMLAEGKQWFDRFLRGSPQRHRRAATSRHRSIGFGPRGAVLQPPTRRPGVRTRGVRAVQVRSTRTITTKRKGRPPHGPAADVAGGVRRAVGDGRRPGNERMVAARCGAQRSHAWRPRDRRRRWRSSRVTP